VTVRAAAVEFECECVASTRAAPVKYRIGRSQPVVVCARCGREHRFQEAAQTPEGGLVGCAHCGHPELYREKDFPRPLGIGVVLVAAALAPFTYYASLAAAAVIDAVLLAVWPERVVCYVCRARHRGFAPTPRHPKFDREIDERLRFGARAVMGKPMRPGGTAGAPEPEH
jgi:hypothetical protein